MTIHLKIFILLASSFVCLQNIHAQADSAKASLLKNRLIDSICICISRTDTNSVNNIAAVQGMLTRCVTANIGLYTDYVTATGNDLSFITPEKMQAIADDIAAEVHNKCAAMELLINHLKRKQE